MNDRSSRPRRARGRVTRAALVAVLALVGPVTAPGTASAVGEVRPFVDCLGKNSDGTYTAVLGYTNSSTSTVTVAVGTRNSVSPSRLDGTQPTTFGPGTKRGVLTLTITASEYLRSGPYWQVDGSVAHFGWSTARGLTTCPSSTELPADGNGTGMVLALAAAGMVGGVLVHRANRRARVLTAAGHDDA